MNEDEKLENEEWTPLLEEGMPEKIKQLILQRKIEKLTGEKIQTTDIPVEDVLDYFELYPLQLYNLFTYVKWHDGISCPTCGAEIIAADISFVGNEYPSYRCIPDVELPSHRFNVFHDSVFEKCRFDMYPLIKCVRLFVFYFNYEKKEPPIREMIEVLGSKNMNMFHQSHSGKLIARILHVAKKSNVFGKNFRIRTFGQLIKVLKWVMTFDRDGTLMVSKLTSMVFNPHKSVKRKGEGKK
jgi:hypothetical protein